MIWPEKRKAKIVFRSNLNDVISPIPPPQMLRKGLHPFHQNIRKTCKFLFLFFWVEQKTWNLDHTQMYHLKRAYIY